MGLFGKPRTGGSSAGRSKTGKNNGATSKHNPENHKPGATGRSSDKNVNSADGGKSFGTPSATGDGSAYDSAQSIKAHNNYEEDRSSYGFSDQRSGAEAIQWGSTGKEAWDGGGAWQSDGWNGNRERGNEW